MATTATFTLTSADIAGDPVNVSKTATCTKAGATTDLDQTTGLSRVHLRNASNKVLLAANAEGNDLAAKVYIINKSTDPSLYVTVTINAQTIGKLYAGDWMFIPWSAEDSSADVKVAPSVESSMKLEYVLVHE